MNRAGEGFLRAGYGFPIKKGFLIPPHPLNIFETQKCYQNGPRFDGVYSRDNLPDKIKDGVYAITFDLYSDIGTHMELNIFQKKLKYHIVAANIFRMQAYDSIRCGYFSI